MKAFVTGGTGFIGGVVVRQLREAGHAVTALARDPRKASSLVDLGARIVAGDLSDRDALREGMAGADALFHIAAWYQIGQRNREEAFRANVEGTRSVLEVMREMEIPRGIYTSSLVVFSDTKGKLVDENYTFHGTHLSEYDRTKWLAHYQVALPMIAAGLPLTIVQPGVVYGLDRNGPMSEVLSQYVQRRLPMIPKGAAYCWGHVEDTARAHIAALEKGRAGESYIIAGPAHSLEAVLELAERITGIPAPRLRIPPWILKTAARIATPFAALLPGSYQPEAMRVGAGATYLGDNSKARRELGFEPRPLEEGLPDTLHFLMEKHGI